MTASNQTQQTPDNMKLGGRYNWRNQPERMTYMGSKFYHGDRRRWHQFEKVNGQPGVVWCEVLDSDLPMFEETQDAAIADAERTTP